VDGFHAEHPGPRHRQPCAYEFSAFHGTLHAVGLPSWTAARYFQTCLHTL
jgi:hypothetical protein